MAEWRPIPGFEELYCVSDNGKVRSERSGNLVSLNTRFNGYKLAHLYPGGGKRNRKAKYVHRLVLEAFVGCCPEGMECRHLNGDRSDNRLCNLQWGTSRQNQADKIAHGTRLQGDRVPASKLSSRAVLSVRWLYRNGVSPVAIAATYSVSVGCIQDICYGKNWTHLGGLTQERLRRNLSPDMVRQIRSRIEQGERHGSIAREFGVHKETVGRIKRGQHHASVA